MTWNKLKKIEKTGNDLINLRKVELVRKKILNIKRRKENYHAQIYSIIPYGNKNYSLKYLKKRKVLYKIPKNLWFINRDELKKK